MEILSYESRSNQAAPCRKKKLLKYEIWNDVNQVNLNLHQVPVAQIAKNTAFKFGTPVPTNLLPVVS